MKLANGCCGQIPAQSKSLARRSLPCRRGIFFKLRARIGMVFQESALFDSLSVEDNRRFPAARGSHALEEEAHVRVVEALKFVET